VGGRRGRPVSQALLPPPPGSLETPNAQLRSFHSAFSVHVRLPVIFRKITFGSQSLRGAQALATNLSLITTAKRHGRDPLERIKTVLLKAGDTPLDALYDPEGLSKTDSS